MDPLSVLGVPQDASPAEVAAAYRRLAKRWHPDRARDAAAVRRMAEINAAYDTLRAALNGRPGGHGRPRQRAESHEPARRPGAWLPEAVRRALGAELLAALEAQEQVELVTPTATWSSPSTVLALTDRRLLWLLDDAITHRVRSLHFGAIERVEQKLRRPLGRAAILRVRTRDGKTLTFAELRPATAAMIAAKVAG